MEWSVVAAVAVAGLVVGRFVVAPITGQVPEPVDQPAAVVTAITVVHALAWAVVAMAWEQWWVVIPFAFLASVLVCVSAIDLRTYRIPNAIVFPALAASIVLLVVATLVIDPAFGAGDALRGAAIGSVTYFAFLFVPHLVYPKGMGMGDVKLALVMGLYLGWGHGSLDAVSVVISGLFVGCLLGSVSGLVANAVRRKSAAFPFGPSLAVGCLFALVRATAGL